MIEKLQIYKCEVCGNIVEVLHAGKGQLTCCGKPMTLQVENTVDASREKHLPVFEDTEEGIKIKVGSIPHPMEEKHYIEWIEVLSENKIFRTFLSPGNPPETSFIGIKKENLVAREYCNLHGLWRTENKQ